MLIVACKTEEYGSVCRPVGVLLNTPLPTITRKKEEEIQEPESQEDKRQYQNLADWLAIKAVLA